MIKRLSAFILATLLAGVAAGQSSDYDVVLTGGRVMDPETGLDAERDVGIRGDRIIEITTETLEGTTVVDVTGLVVAPGFIDPHAHGQTNDAHRYQARDGVTTALELESGRPFLRKWLQTKEGRALINYGATMAHSTLRWMAMDKYQDVAREARVLGRYVRERKALGLMDAIAKMTLMPAERLEGMAPAMRLKGPLQVGCDADITVFDPETVIDTATFEDGLSESKGIQHVLVNGNFVVRDGESPSDVSPGRAVMGKYRR